MLWLVQPFWFLRLQDDLQQQPSGNLGEKIKVYHLQDLEMIQHIQGYIARSQVESTYAQVNGSAVLGSRMGPKVLEAHSLLANLNCKRKNLRHRK